MSDPSVTTITASINLKDLLGSYLDFTVVGVRKNTYPICGELQAGFCF